MVHRSWLWIGERTVRTSTWPGPGCGTGRSATVRTSAGSPKVSCTTARMVVGVVSVMGQSSETTMVTSMLPRVAFE